MLSVLYAVEVVIGTFIGDDTADGSVDGAKVSDVVGVGIDLFGI